MSRPVRTTAVLAALVLSLAACGSSGGRNPAESSDGGGIEATQPAEDAAAASTDDTDAGEEAADQGAGGLTITLDGEETVFRPEIVRCTGEPGTVRNVVMTMEDDELPLIKVTPGEFAMVKLQHRGEPEETSSPQDITADDGRISFDSATIGGATIDGTVRCLQGDRG